MAAFKKLRMLGRGSYATVYLAEIILPHEKNCKAVAVKSSSPLSYSISSLQKEKKILDSFLGCQEILQIYFAQFNIERNNMTYNLFMEFAPYGSLGDLIKKRSLSMMEARIYTHMLLKGLSCIHKKGIIHSDLKPDNILLFPSPEGYLGYQLKIADFGMSKTKEETFTEIGKIKFRGTPLYMSPESIVGIIDTSLDIWSLGCIVIEMITRFCAWEHLLTQKEMMIELALLREVPPIPNGLSWDCENFLSKCLMKISMERWTATMLLNHPFLYSADNMRKGYQTSPTISSSFFTYDIFDYVCHLKFNIFIRCTKCLICSNVHFCNFDAV